MGPMLTDQVAIVTGGARGIGREIALTFAKEGAHLALWDVNQALLDEAVRLVEAAGRQAIGLAVDVTQPDDVEAAVNKTLDKFQRIDILVNNAGITRDALLLRMSVEDWDRVLNVNLRGTFLCTKAVCRVMLKQRAGRIVNIASIIGLIGNAGQGNYAASKAGVIALTKSTAKELASRGVTCNAIAPGFIQTEMTEKLSPEVRERLAQQIPLGRLGQPADVANAALVLTSPLAHYITGQVLVVDGGMVM